MSEDPYVYPGTFTLTNLRGIRDPDKLHDFEANSTFRRTLELLDRPITGKFTRSHLQRIHKYLFQDVYAWAGQSRTIDIRKEDSTYFARPEFIGPSLDELFTKLERKGGLVGLDATAFSERAGDLLGDLNAIHPFREGNGRAQQEFLRQLAARGGHELSWAGVSREDMYRESAISFTIGDSSGLGKLIRSAIVPPDRDVERAAFAYRALEKMRADSPTILKSEIKEQRPFVGATLSGRVCLVGEHHIAIATGARTFSVLARGMLNRSVIEGEKIRARIEPGKITIEAVALSRSASRKR